jgi:hypothetical protein
MTLKEVLHSPSDPPMTLGEWLATIVTFFALGVALGLAL